MQHQNECIRGTFIGRLRSFWMRQRLLANVTLGLDELFNQSCTLVAAARNAEFQIYLSSIFRCVNTRIFRSARLLHCCNPKCIFCGNKKHSRSRCPCEELNAKGARNWEILPRCVGTPYLPQSTSQKRLKHQRREYRSRNACDDKSTLDCISGG